MANRVYPSFWLYKDSQNQWRWTYEASNARTVAVSSESYVKRSDCERSIEIMRDCFSTPVWVPIHLGRAA